MNPRKRFYYVKQHLIASLDLIENYGGLGEPMGLRAVCDMGNSEIVRGRKPLIERDAWVLFCGAIYPDSSGPARGCEAAVSPLPSSPGL